MNEKKTEVRVRFAPSPTGHLHIGNLRTALFNWLFARHNGGQFVVRIEDTDHERSREEYVGSLMQVLSWLGLESDEPLVFQSQRTEIYKNYLDIMLNAGSAYWSDPADEENGISVIRFRVPRGRGPVSFDDQIRGRVTVELDQIDDFVIARADGSPLYNFVVVVDDALMSISHVIRGEDHISNTARQILMYEALDFTPPRFAHLALIVGPTGAPLSKRDAVTSVLQYREMGYLPDALCNYLVRLGWAHGDQEIFTRDELIRLFSLEAIHKSSAMFDAEKLAWFNSVYMRQTSSHDLLKYTITDVDPILRQSCSEWNEQQLLDALDLYKERVATLKELADQLIRLHTLPTYSTLPDNEWDDQTIELLQQVRVRLSQLEAYTIESIKELIKMICSEYNVKLPALAKPIRFALTGTMESPSVFALLQVLGPDESVKRIELLQKKLEG